MGRIIGNVEEASTVKVELPEEVKAEKAEKKTKKK